MSDYPHHALIIDDETDLTELMAMTLNGMQIGATACHTLSDAFDIINQPSKLAQFNFCVTDLNLPDGNGLDLVKYIQTEHINLPIAVLTAYGSQDLAIEALKAGAFDFINKPIDLNKLKNIIKLGIKVNTEQDKKTKHTSSNIIGRSKPIQTLKNKINKLAKSQAPVYIQGESGAGKELVAREIHLNGPRSEGPFIAINCGAIPRELMESEFFGHVKGSFTGANSNKKGLFEAAKGGTLFLDEIADLPLDMQVKLLRAIQEKSIRPVGANSEITTDIRLLSATHKDLQTLITKGLFREDLYYRINVIQINIPPLRERKEDIALITEYLLHQLEQDWEQSLPKMSDETLQRLKEYDFPGNVRELQNALERAVTLCDEDTLLPEHFELSGNTMLSISKTQQQPSTEPPSDGHTQSNSELTIPKGFDLESKLETIEKAYILQALEKTRWNRTQAAELLGMSFRSLRYKIKKLEIDTDEEDEN